MSLFTTGESVGPILAGFGAGMLLRFGMAMAMCIGLGTMAACTSSRSLTGAATGLGWGSGILGSGLRTWSWGTRISRGLRLGCAAARLGFAFSAT